MKLHIATCRPLPEPDPDEDLLLAALAAGPLWNSADVAARAAERGWEKVVIKPPWAPAHLKRIAPSALERFVAGIRRRLAGEPLDRTAESR